MSNSTFKKIKAIIAPILDGVIGIMAIVAGIMMFNLGGKGLATSGISFLRYFTVQSNLLCGLAAFVTLPFDLLVLRKKKEANPKGIQTMFLVLSVGTTVTFLTVLFFLGPTMGYGLMYEGANLFMHMLIPLFAFVRVAFFEKEGNQIPFRCTFFGMVHLFGYGVFYILNVAIHNGYGDTNYDWYGFGKAGLAVGLLAFVIMVGAAYLVAWLTYLLQKKINEKAAK